MLLDTSHKDALNELIHIGFSRSANALTLLVSKRVRLEASDVNIYPTSALKTALQGLTRQEIVNVHQVFRGKLSGDAMLLMDSGSASVLVDMLSGGAGRAHELTAMDREALIETGNILLNAFIGSFGNLLKVHLMFTVPHLQLESLKDILNTLSAGGEAGEYALVVKVKFRLEQGDVSGYVLIVMGSQSLEALFDAMKAEGFLN